MNNDKIIQQLNELFGSYRAEWLKDNIFHFFTKPSYFHELEDSRPCVLEGGRGSGKTSVLRGLSYQGQFALHNNEIDAFDKNVNYIGLYHRVDTNHVRSFIGDNISAKRWEKIFGHYFNMIICNAILNFIIWHKQQQSTDETPSSHDCRNIAKSLALPSPEEYSTVYSLNEALKEKMYEFQVAVNNIVDFNSTLQLSLSGDPIKLLTQIACSLPQFNKKVFFILIDEYENYEDYQQVIINTLLKHNTDYFTFKIGVRELGWRKKHTLNSDELLNDPADYVLLNIESIFIEGHDFEDFVQEVCQQRIQKLLELNNINNENFNIKNSLQELTYEDEAILLGIENTPFIKEDLQEYRHIKLNVPPLYKFLIVYWSKIQKRELSDVIEDFLHNRKEWDERYNNYKYEMLFKIRTGRGSGGISKYYCGWDTFVKLASGNIRFLMALVYRTFEKHLEDGNDILSPISYENQTKVAYDFGKNSLIQLESLCKEGAKLAKLLHSIGKIFNIFAKTKGKHAPEINQFTIENSRELSDDCQSLISVAVMNLAFVRETGTKLGETETKDYTYSIHPIFAPFFIFSYRKKRKLVLKQEDFIGLINLPKAYISKILKTRNIDYEENDDTHLNIIQKESNKQLTLFN